MSSARESSGRDRDASRAGSSPPDVPIADKVRFLSQAANHPHGPERVELRETHMSWLFLTGTLVYKLKKPVIYPFLDFSTLAARLQNCRAELALNRRLAGDVYRRLVPLRRLPSGQLTMAEEGDVVDWMVEMTQLAEADMLDARIRAQAATRDEVALVGDTLARFYLVTVPLTASVIAGGVVVLAAPWLALLGAIVGLATKVRIEIVRDRAANDQSPPEAR
jgi:aminoglycoside phosphotransferase family enzyme